MKCQPKCKQECGKIHKDEYLNPKFHLSFSSNSRQGQNWNKRDEVQSDIILHTHDTDKNFSFFHLI